MNLVKGFIPIQEFQLFRNLLLNKEIHPVSAIDFKDFLLPWHLILLEKIGLYSLFKNNNLNGVAYVSNSNHRQ